MKINHTPAKGPLSQTGDVGRAQGHGVDKSAPATRSAPSASTVALSSTGRHLATLANAENDVNIVRANEIRAALAAGTLQIDPERIADGLIDSARELLKS